MATNISNAFKQLYEEHFESVYKSDLENKKKEINKAYPNIDLDKIDKWWMGYPPWPYVLVGYSSSKSQVESWYEWYCKNASPMAKSLL